MATKATWVYDIEVYRNYFCATFIDVDHISDMRVHVINKATSSQELAYFMNFLKHEVAWLVGFNNISYDDPVLRYIIENESMANLNLRLFNLSKTLISDDSKFDDRIKKLRYPARSHWQALDLMTMMAFDKLGVGLKQAAINLQWHRIQDLPIPFDATIMLEDEVTLLEYNLNDTLITLALFNKLKKEIDLRREISALYDVNVMSASDSKIANVILEKMYVERSGVNLRELRHKRTNYTEIRLEECVAPGIRFGTIDLNILLDTLKEKTVTAEDNFKFKYSLHFHGVEYEIGVGGLHSKDEPGKFVSNDEYTIRDADVTSFYPNIMISNGIKPDHLSEEFLEVLKTIAADRIEAKKSGNKTKSEALKITINSIFGKLNSDYFWLKDPKAMLQVTISGQLYLLMLVEMLTEQGIEVISANTDGILCKVHKSQENTYSQICQQWMERTSFELEFTDYDLYVRSDVNNYLARKMDGKIKAKGSFVKEIDMKKGYSMPVVAECLHAWFLDGIHPKIVLACNQNIFDFCISQKSSSDFQTEMHTQDAFSVLQKNNRFFASMNGAHIMKRHKQKDTLTHILADSPVTLLNDANPDTNITEYRINTGYYEWQAMKIINEIDPIATQLEMF